jgi:NADPH:quinone reductase-like Zn-dependent oxidoreductase
MRAVCVDESRNLQLRDITSPSAPSPGYVTVKITAAAINHGDITFLKFPGAAGGASAAREESVWGSSAAGIVTQIRAEVPEQYMGRKFAIYRSMHGARHFLESGVKQPRFHSKHVFCFRTTLTYETTADRLSTP